MKNRQFFVDIHCHPNMRPFNSGFPEPIKSIWENVTNDIDYPENAFAKIIEGVAKNIYKHSQSNFNNLAKGNIKVAFNSLYPIERGFLSYNSVPRWLFGKENINAIYEYTSGFPIERIRHLQNSHNSYFEELEAEYQFLLEGQGQGSGSDHSYRLVNSFSDLEKVLEEPNSIAVILSIEGAHSFGTGTPQADSKTRHELRKTVMNNIGRVKSWEFNPFFINLSHHFWNHLCGHAPSIKFPVNQILNQRRGLGLGMTDLGRDVVHELLSDDNGKPILIDIKHMSVKGRKDYYAMLDKYKREKGRKIPVICSHTGVNGYKTMDESVNQRDGVAKSKNSYLHRWSINLSDEEIRIIHDSEGTIGIMLDKGLLGGQRLLESISGIKDQQHKRDEFSKLIFTNIFQVISAVGKKSAWDLLTVGSDFDGGITHIDHYDNAATFVDMYHDLVSYLDRTEMNKELWYGYRPREIVNKIMRENAILFMEKYFV